MHYEFTHFVHTRKHLWRSQKLCPKITILSKLCAKSLRISPDYAKNTSSFRVLRTDCRWNRTRKKRLLIFGRNAEKCWSKSFECVKKVKLTLTKDFSPWFHFVFHHSRKTRCLTFLNVRRKRIRENFSRIGSNKCKIMFRNILYKTKSSFLIWQYLDLYHDYWLK